MSIFGALFLLALKTLIVFWFVATWFPQLGLTYWQLALPVEVIAMLTGRVDYKPILPKGFENYVR